LNAAVLGALVVFWIFGEGSRPLINIVSIQHRSLEFARIDELLLDSSELAKPNSFFAVDCRLLAQLTIIFSTMRMTKIKQSQICKTKLIEIDF